MINFLSVYTDFERRGACLKALLNCSEYDYFKQEFAERGIVDILLDIIQNSIENPLELWELSFNILSNICKGVRQN